jgi:hypothetical protein
MSVNSISKIWNIILVSDFDCQQVMKKHKTMKNCDITTKAKTNIRRILTPQHPFTNLHEYLSYLFHFSQMIFDEENCCVTYRTFNILGCIFIWHAIRWWNFHFLFFSHREIHPNADEHLTDSNWEREVFPWEKKRKLADIFQTVQR